jgi:hypothetical protein
MVGVVFGIISGIVSIVCMIVVLRKMFSESGTLQGLLGLFCALYAYAWGWIHQDDQNLMDVMFIWTISILLGIVANLMMGESSF